MGIDIDNWRPIDPLARVNWDGHKEEAKKEAPGAIKSELGSKAVAGAQDSEASLEAQLRLEYPDEDDPDGTAMAELPDRPDISPGGNALRRGIGERALVAA